MPRKLDHDVFYRPPGTPLYNIFFKGGALQGRVTVRAFEGLRPEQNDRVWMTVWGSVAFGYGEA